MQRVSIITQIVHDVEIHNIGDFWSTYVVCHMLGGCGRGDARALALALDRACVVREKLLA